MQGIFGGGGIIQNIDTKTIISGITMKLKSLTRDRYTLSQAQPPIKVCA